MCHIWLGTRWKLTHWKFNTTFTKLLGITRWLDLDSQHENKCAISQRSSYVILHVEHGVLVRLRCLCYQQFLDKWIFDYYQNIMYLLNDVRCCWSFLSSTALPSTLKPLNLLVFIWKWKSRFVWYTHHFCIYCCCCSTF